MFDKNAYCHVVIADGRKYVVIGDIHGKSIWEKIVDEHYDDAYKIIFVGDYVDSFDVSRAEELTNLRNIIAFKLRNMDKVVLLLGNHDAQYLFKHQWHKCSGFDPRVFPVLHQLFNKYKHLFQLAYEIRHEHIEELVTHAGITKQWWDERFIPWITNQPHAIEILLETPHSICEMLNLGFHIYYESQRNGCPLWDVGIARRGNAPVGGPVWCDKSMLKHDAYPDLMQIVGHTASSEMEQFYNKQTKACLTFIDVLSAKEVLENIYRKSIEKFLHEEPDFYYTIPLKDNEWQRTGTYKDGGTVKFKVSTGIPFKFSADKRILAMNRDRSTEMIMEPGHTFYIDRRIGSETKGKVFDKYPEEKDARRVNIVFV